MVRKIQLTLDDDEYDNLKSGGSIKINWERLGKKIAKELANAGVKTAVSMAGATIGLPAPVSAIVGDKVGKLVNDKMVKKGFGINKINKRRNPWIDHLKRYMQEHHCSYREAIKNAKSTYKRK